MNKAYSLLLIYSLSYATVGDEFIKRYILSHPETIAEAMRIHQDNLLQEKLQDIVSDQTSSLVLKNPKAKNTLVAYVDHRCGACRRSHDWVEQFMNKHRDVRWEVRPLPVLGGESVSAALMMYDVNHKGKSSEWYHQVFSSNRPMDKDRLQSLAEQYKVRVTEPNGFMEHWATKHIKKNFEQSNALDNQAVPLYILTVNGKHQVLKGISSFQDLDEAYQKLRRA